MIQKKQGQRELRNTGQHREFVRLSILQLMVPALRRQIS